MTKSDLVAYAVALPKAELQLHIEGTLEPEMMLSLAQRNKTDIPHATVDDIRTAYQFSHPQQFVEIYQQSQQVLRTEEDFFDLTMAYLNRSCAHNVRHAEISFSPQGHMARGVTFNTVVGGILTALSLAKMQFGMSTSLIMNVSSQLSEDNALDVMHHAEPWLEQITGISLSLANAEQSPAKFTSLFQTAHDRDLKSVVQFDHDSAATQISETLDQFNVNRIGCGSRILKDDALLERLVGREIGMTVSPLSGALLTAEGSTLTYPLKNMLERALPVTINSNVPAFLGGYMLDNFKAIIDGSELSFGDVKRLVKNSFTSSFLPEGQKRAQLAAVDLV